MRFVAFNIDGGYTELWKKDQSQADEVYNCQLLYDSEADSQDDFLQELKSKWKSHDIGSVMILKVDESFEPVYVNI